MTYLMASNDEAARLQAQADANPSLRRLLWSGLRAGQRVLDAGCGPGAIDGEILDVIGGTGTLTGVDVSPELLAAAKARFAGRSNASFLTGALPKLDLADASFDFVFSQYVFEYLKDPAAALAELVRLTRPGGTVVVADIDGHGLANWPFPAELLEGTQRLIAALASQGFDLHVGRKMFTHFRAAGLTDIAVDISPFYVIAGSASPDMLQDWKVRFTTLAPLGNMAFGSAAAYQAYVEKSLTLLADPDGLKYSVVLTTRGVKT